MVDRNGAGDRVGLLRGSIAAHAQPVVRCAAVGRSDPGLRGRIAGLGVDGG
jgi:hypothetical protein